jgi:hypothetical protein
MGAAQRRKLQELEGCTVHISMADGSRLDEVSLVSARRSTVWIFANGEDTFLPVDQVIDVWEAQPLRFAA